MAQVFLSNISEEEVAWAVYTDDGKDQGNNLKSNDGIPIDLNPDVSYVGFISFNGSVMMTGPATGISPYAAELIAFDSSASADDVRKALVKLHAKSDVYSKK